jgi:hypothetical protein
LSDALEAFVDVQKSVDDPPLCTEFGFAESVHDGGFGICVTTTCVWHVTVWPF